MSGPRAKSADVVGQTMKLNPHGDQTITDDGSFDKGNKSLLHPWIDSKGNFGDVASRDMQYAASRYTEVRLEPSCETLFSGLSKDAVDFVDNYSGRSLSCFLPCSRRFSSTTAKVAVGMASSVCS